MNINDRLTRAVLELAADAYSRPNYTEAGWRACAKMLIKRGCSVQEAAAVLMSKWTRWAADHSDAPYGRHTAKDLERLLDSSPKHYSMAEIKKLAAETFGGES